MKNLFLLLYLFSSFSFTSLGANDLPKVLIMGDSISIGYTPHVVENLKGVAEVKRHKGNAGPTIRVAKIEEWLGDGKWDLIHFNWGLWDMYGWEYHRRIVPRSLREKARVLGRSIEEDRSQLIGRPPRRLAGPQAHHETAVQAGVDSKGSRAEYLRCPWRDEKNGVQINDLHAFMKPQWAKYAIADNNVHFKPEEESAGKTSFRLIADALKERVSGKLNTRANSNPTERRQGFGGRTRFCQIRQPRMSEGRFVYFFSSESFLENTLTNSTKKHRVRLKRGI